ncbi:MAG: hypothetical protein JST00_29310 [Deltaproteobacteria bacterium]|nr:hypothetical protein [Deltaproteobacteria bacterium]
MKLGKQLVKGFEEAAGGDFESALLHATIAVDATSKRLYPAETRVGERYKRSLRDYYWLLEPMIGGGINLVETRFTNVQSLPDPDLADLVYSVFRCGHCHGDEISPAFAFTKSHGEVSTWELTRDVVRMPDRFVWALLSVVVLSHVNAREGADTLSLDYHLTLGPEGPFFVSEWWGRENDFRPIAARYNKVRVKLDGLGGFPPVPSGESGDRSQ